MKGALRPARVVVVVLDAMPHRHVGPELTPVLWSLAREGGRAPNGGRAVLSASTYPNHATFVTGVDPAIHGIATSKAFVDGAFRPAHEVGPAAPTLFDRCKDADRRSVAVFGDQYLVGVCGARAAAHHWPPDGTLPKDAPRGALGFGADRAVVAALDAADVESAELLFIQLDETDTARHIHGPDAPESLEQFRATDAAFGEVLERLRPRWDDTVVIALSDHDHEAVKEGAIDLAAEVAQRGLDLAVDCEGTAALIVGDVAEEKLLELPGVTHSTIVGERRTLVWGDLGQQFGIDWGLKGHHGSPRTATQLVIVGGGHPAVAGLARTVAATTPAASSWSGAVCDLLELPGSSATSPSSPTSSEPIRRG